MQTQICIEMETGDIDDILTLIILLQNKDIKIKAIVVTPGSLAQLGLIHFILQKYGYSIPIGGYDLESDAKLGHQYKKLFAFVPATTGLDGVSLLKDNSGPDVILFTIGPPKASGQRLSQRIYIFLFNNPSNLVCYTFFNVKKYNN